MLMLAPSKWKASTFTAPGNDLTTLHGSCWASLQGLLEKLWLLGRVVRSMLVAVEKWVPFGAYHPIQKS